MHALICESPCLVGMWYHLALFYTEQEIGPAYTIIATASSLSGVAGGPLAAQLLQMDGFLGLHGWQVLGSRAQYMLRDTGPIKGFHST